MIDFHNHILPDVDDGSKSLEMSLDMLREAERQGITDVVNTVHFQHPKMDEKNVDYSFIETIKDNLQNKIDGLGINIKLHIGAEVFYLPNLLDIKSNTLVGFGHGKYMLIEFYPFHLPPNFDNHFYQLKLSGTTPIIAHPERNKMIQNDMEILAKLIDSGCLIQLDAGSLLGHFGPTCKEVAKSLLGRNMVHFIGSDAHNNKKRDFCLAPAVEIARGIMGDNVDILVNDNPSKVISGENIIPFEMNEPFTPSNFITRLFNKIKKIK